MRNYGNNSSRDEDSCSMMQEIVERKEGRNRKREEVEGKK